MPNAWSPQLAMSFSPCPRLTSISIRFNDGNGPRCRLMTREQHLCNARSNSAAASSLTPCPVMLARRRGICLATDGFNPRVQPSRRPGLSKGASMSSAIGTKQMCKPRWMNVRFEEKNGHDAYVDAMCAHDPKRTWGAECPSQNVTPKSPEYSVMF
jgi:hypothetical protein